MSVQPKKHLGQHFLTDQNTCRKIVEQYTNFGGTNNVLEIGPGMGAITQYFLDIENIDLHVMEIDRDSVAYLQDAYPVLNGKIHSERSEEHTSELQSRPHLVCRLLLEKKKNIFYET